MRMFRGRFPINNIERRQGTRYLMGIFNMSLERVRERGGGWLKKTDTNTSTNILTLTFWQPGDAPPKYFQNGQE